MAERRSFLKDGVTLGTMRFNGECWVWVRWSDGIIDATPLHYIGGYRDGIKPHYEASWS